MGSDVTKRVRSIHAAAARGYRGPVVGSGVQRKAARGLAKEGPEEVKGVSECLF